MTEPKASELRPAAAPDAKQGLVSELLALVFRLFRHTAILLGKDLLLEWRTKARINALIFFSVATMLMFSFALGTQTEILSASAGGFYWLAILFASVLALGESFRVEQENAALDGVRMAPGSARAVFLAKAIGNTILLWLLSILLVPLTVALCGVHFEESFWRLASIQVLGCMAISAPGTLYSAIANNARSRDVLLPLLLFPLLVPALVSAAKATSLVFQRDAMNQFDSWWALLAAFNMVYWSLGFLLFPKVIED